MGDPLFLVRNNFYLGNYNNVINEAADMDNLSSADAVERDCFVYRSYIALGSFDVSGQQQAADAVLCCCSINSARQPAFACGGQWKAGGPGSESHSG